MFRAFALVVGTSVLFALAACAGGPGPLPEQGSDQTAQGGVSGSDDSSGRGNDEGSSGSSKGGKGSTPPSSGTSTSPTPTATTGPEPEPVPMQDAGE